MIIPTHLVKSPPRAMTTSVSLSVCLSPVEHMWEWYDKNAQLTLRNPRDAKACQNCSNSTCLQPETKTQKLKLKKLLQQRWRTDSMLYIVVFGYNWTTDCLIFAKFYTMTQNPTIITPTCCKFQTFRIQNGGPPPSWNRYIAIFR